MRRPLPLLTLLAPLCACSTPEPPHPLVAIAPPGAAAMPLREADVPAPVAEPPAAVDLGPPEAPPAPPPLPRGTTILHIGDSMADALSTPLREEMARAGVKVVNRFKTGSHIPVWGGQYSNVPALVRQYQPDLVIINLGGNEILLDDPASRATYIEKLVAIVGDRPCVWVAPSLWRHETGILGVIRAHATRCRYFDTNVITPDLERTRADPIHPAIPARRKWARARVAWLARERDPAGAHPWSMRPDASASSSAPVPLSPLERPGGDAAPPPGPATPRAVADDPYGD